VVFQKRIRALTRDSVTYYRALRYGQDHPVVEAGLGIVARRKDDGQTAILKISSFDPDILQSRYQQDYRRAMDSVFLWLERMRITRLVVDLRDNQGGDFPPGRYLLAYLLATPASFLFGGPEARVIRPAAHRFAGKLVVLVNGGSFSSTAIVAAILEREKRAVFVGEETGGNKYLISGDPAEVLLPHTGISCSISTVIFRIGKGVNNGHGVMPEYRVVPGIEDRLARRDPALEKAIAVP
jgi:C-terminal processing protease CtpA/Prc